jgi:hypothetical protein
MEAYKVDSLTRRPPLNARAIVRLEGLRQLKNPMTWTGIENATFLKKKKKELEGWYIGLNEIQLTTDENDGKYQDGLLCDGDSNRAPPSPNTILGRYFCANRLGTWYSFVPTETGPSVSPAMTREVCKPIWRDQQTAKQNAILYRQVNC